MKYTFVCEAMAEIEEKPGENLFQRLKSAFHKTDNSRSECLQDLAPPRLLARVCQQGAIGENLLSKLFWFSNKIGKKLHVTLAEEF